MSQAVRAEEASARAEPGMSYAIARLHQRVFTSITRACGAVRSHGAPVHDLERAQPSRRSAVDVAAGTARVYDSAVDERGHPRARAEGTHQAKPASQPPQDAARDPHREGTPCADCVRRVSERVRRRDAGRVLGCRPRDVPRHDQGGCAQSRRRLSRVTRSRSESGSLNSVGAVSGPLAAQTVERLACDLSGVTKAFGAVKAVDSVSLGISAGSLTCLIGPNGAGKSTLLGCISGFHLVDEGVVRVDDERSRSGRRTAGPGRGWRPSSRRHVRWSSWTCSTTRPSALTFGRAAGSSRACCVFPGRDGSSGGSGRRLIEALEIVGLEGRASDPAAVLPLGQLRLLAIARALAQRPSVLLLDEPAAGLRAGEKARLIEALRTLSRRGLTHGAGRARHAVRRRARRTRRRARPRACDRRRHARRRSGATRR